MYGRRNVVTSPAGDNTINASANVGTTQNRHTFYGDTTRPMFAATIYALVMLTMVVVVMCLLFREWVIRATIVVFAALVVALVALLVLFIVRYGAGTIAHIFISLYTAAWHKVVYTDGTHTMVKDKQGDILVHDLTYVTENRQILPPAIDKAPTATEYILAAWDKGSSARKIEKYLNEGRPKDEHVSYYHIQKTLDTYRQGWQGTHKKGDVSEQYDYDD